MHNFVHFMKPIYRIEIKGAKLRSISSWALNEPSLAKQDLVRAWLLSWSAQFELGLISTQLTLSLSPPKPVELARLIDVPTLETNVWWSILFETVDLVSYMYNSYSIYNKNNGKENEIEKGSIVVVIKEKYCTKKMFWYFGPWSNDEGMHQLVIWFNRPLNLSK